MLKCLKKSHSNWQVGLVSVKVMQKHIVNHFASVNINKDKHSSQLMRL